jgi:hypothetical protein
MTDARFEDGAEKPLRLIAQDADGLPVISALIQDAVLPITEMAFDRKARKLSLLLNRFRWEDRPAAERRGRVVERVRSVLTIADIRRLSTQGIDRDDRDTVLSVLALSWHPGEDGTGRVVLTLAGDGAIAADVECLDLTLTDVTRPYRAPSGKAPSHPE